MTTPIWLLRSLIDAVHDAQVAEHGGADGLRDEGALDSALARPINLHAYGETDVFRLAAAYAFGIVRNHPFVDGNKRVGHAAMVTFLLLNGFDIIATVDGQEQLILELAAGRIRREDVGAWLQSHAKKLDSDSAV